MTALLSGVSPSEVHAMAERYHRETQILPKCPTCEARMEVGAFKDGRLVCLGCAGRTGGAGVR